MSGNQKERGLLDTSVVILLGKVEASALPRFPIISTITLAELSVGPLVAKSEAERLERQARLLQASSDFEPIPFDGRAAHAFGTVSANLRQAGRKTTARSLDAMIAATALSRALPLFTANPRDFEGINSLEVVPVTTD